MDRPDTTPIALLTAILARLREQLGLDANQCFLAWQPLALEEVPRGGDYFLAVSPGEGRFEPAEQFPGNITEAWTFAVTIYVRCALDRADEAEKTLLNASRGLYERKRQVLAALVGWDLEVAQRQLVYCIRSSGPQLLQRLGGPQTLLWGLTLEFGLPFDWELASSSG